jgi:hypothetical protein
MDDSLSLVPGTTSYFSTPESELDPILFDGTHLRADIRSWILGTVYPFLERYYVDPRNWARVWIAGSGISYQWSANRDPADLDVMLGLDYIRFRQANPAFAGLTNAEIAQKLNRRMIEELWPDVSDVDIDGDAYDMTVYINPGVTTDPDGIKFINPYAAYDVSADEWTVFPEQNPAVLKHPSWDMSIDSDTRRAETIVREYGKAIREIQNAQNSAHRINAENRLTQVLEAADAWYAEIHAHRKAAFGPAGRGYADFANYRWQSGKATGATKAMRRLREYRKERLSAQDYERYGMELPDTDTLVRRAALYRAGA